MTCVRWFWFVCDIWISAIKILCSIFDWMCEKNVKRLKWDCIVICTSYLFCHCFRCGSCIVWAILWRLLLLKNAQREVNSIQWCCVYIIVYIPDCYEEYKFFVCHCCGLVCANDLQHKMIWLEWLTMRHWLERFSGERDISLNGWLSVSLLGCLVLTLSLVIVSWIKFEVNLYRWNPTCMLYW